MLRVTVLILGAAAVSGFVLPRLVTASESNTEEATMQKRSQVIRDAFNGLDRETMHLLDDFYAEDVVFEDPLGRIEGRDGLKAYYAGLYENVGAIAFEFTDEVVQGDTHVAFWTMTMTAKRLNRGRPVVLDGNSVIRFGDTDQVVYHRDYFDLGAMVYEHVPVFGFAVKKLKSRLAAH